MTTPSSTGPSGGGASTRARIYTAVGVAATVIVILLALTLFGFHTMNGIRAFVEGEGLWTKQERDAIQSLRSYVYTGDEPEYQRFLEHLDVLAGVERSRLELSGPDPDIALVRQGFLDLGLDARDLDDMVRLFRRFRRFEHVQTAIARWTDADDEAHQLRDVGGEIHRDMLGREASPLAIDRHLARVDALAVELNAAERDFSASLGTAAHWALSLLTGVMTGFAMLAIGVLGALLVTGARLIRRAERANVDLERQAQLREGLARLNDDMRGGLDEAALCQAVIDTLADLTDAPVGAFHVVDDDGSLRLAAGHATGKISGSSRLARGEGLVGQAAADGRQRVLDDIPASYLTLRTGLGSAPPRQLVLQPIRFEGRVIGVIELATLNQHDDDDLELLRHAAENIGIALTTAQARERLQELLEETQAQSEELQTQQEELRQANDELVDRTRALEQSKGRLQAQQAELENINAELEERSEALQREAQRTARQNAELALARDQIERKADELEQMSRYKSEFLANMSHELRTPLNSILLLSKLLADNKGGNLTERQIEFARTVHDSGNELIALIDEILDQARIEAGQLRLHIESVDLGELLTGIDRQFRPTVEHKGLDFAIRPDPALPVSVTTDGQRLRQILKNLLSNAVKFTEHGTIAMEARPADPATLPEQLARDDGGDFIELSVRDTGIGIAHEMHQHVFEAFRQAEGSTDRKYGGTGLGLAISRKLAEMLGGTLVLDSEPGRGSCFTLLLPAAAQGDMDREEQTLERAVDPLPPEEDDTGAAAVDGPIAGETTRADHDAGGDHGRVSSFDTSDDRESVTAEDRTVLIVEDDPVFASLLAELARERQFRVLTAATGADGLSLARHYRPSAILLDIGLPDIDGLSVIGQLKEDLDVRHIPVHVISAHERNLDALRSGAVGYLRKPVNPSSLGGVFSQIEQLIERPVRRLLVAVSDARERADVVAAVGGEDVDVTAVERGREALAAIKGGAFDCAVVQWDLPDLGGKEVLLGVRQTAGVSNLPMIILSDAELARDETMTIDRYADRHVVRDDRATARLLDDTALFLHRVEAALPEDQKRIIRMLHDRESLFRDRKLLVVDDDMRNVFALCSLLEGEGLEIEVARNGVEALAKLDEHTDTDLVLMDSMMPEMDGYEAMRRIRADGRFDKLPIIALTAKAMRGDRAQCIEAGASDYLTKPVDDDKLLSMLRVWLYR